MECRVSIQWTDTAKESLKALPKKVRKGLLDKADELLQCGDPREAHKPLIGPLSGFYSIKYSRYRALYRVREEKIKDGVLLQLEVTFIVAGKRKEYDKHDVYEVAKKLAQFLFEKEKPRVEAPERIISPRRSKKKR